MSQGLEYFSLGPVNSRPVPTHWHTVLLVRLVIGYHRFAMQVASRSFLSTPMEGIRGSWDKEPAETSLTSLPRVYNR
ncbi:hypothetical protein GWI33_022317 [Rhynchophorus ferrugineus]|uniref:Uncharacterized protein n=1 Tax=Rhynchophorus ferrugineus TaxID=354439 RepID=A0A834ING5_RHYFE|nr:hypothetical protein GWI33_022317 [Rhynchophorus ferrugineus]